MIETNVKFTEREKLDFTYMLTAWNTSMEFCIRPLPVDGNSYICNTEFQ